MATKSHNIPTWVQYYVHGFFCTFLIEEIINWVVHIAFTQSRYVISGNIESF